MEHEKLREISEIESNLRQKYSSSNIHISVNNCCIDTSLHTVKDVNTDPNISLPLHASHNSQVSNWVNDLQNTQQNQDLILLRTKQREIQRDLELKYEAEYMEKLSDKIAEIESKHKEDIKQVLVLICIEFPFHRIFGSHINISTSLNKTTTMHGNAIMTESR